MFAMEKLDVFNEAMSSAYAPVSISQPNSDLSGKTDFLKTLENKSAKQDSVEISGGVQPERKEESYRDKKMEKDEPRTPKDLKEDNRKKSDGNSPEKQEKTIDKKDNQEKSQKAETAAKQTSAEDKNKVPKQSVKSERNDSVKQLLQKHQIQIEEIGEMKEGAAEKFTESKTRANNASEKIVLNNLSGDKKEVDPKIAENPEKSESFEELITDKKLMKEMDVKEQSVPVKNEPKARKAQASDNNAFNFLDQNGKPTDQVKDVQVKKVLNPQNMFEQYQGLKDKVSESVENSIKFLMANGESRVTMQLQPPELGKVEVELMIKDNQITAKINTESIAVKEVILNNLEQLKSNLENAGTGVDKFDVEVGGFKNQLDQHLSDGGSGGNGKKGDGGQGGEQNPNEPMPGKIMNHKALTHYLGRSINVVI